jgi:hypothetical protein
MPTAILVEYCFENICNYFEEILRVKNLNTRIDDIYIKAEKINLIIYPAVINNQNCIVSAKRVKIFKNEIPVKNIQKDSNISVFTDNFILTKFENKNSLEQLYTNQYYIKTKELFKKIELLIQKIQKPILFNELFGNYYSYIKLKKDLFDNLDKNEFLVSKFKQFFNNKTAENSNTTDCADKNFNIHEIIANLTENNFNDQFYENYLTAIKSDKNTLSNFIRENSDKFKDVLADKFKRQTFSEIEKLDNFKFLGSLNFSNSDELNLLSNIASEISNNEFNRVVAFFNNLKNDSLENSKIKQNLLNAIYDKINTYLYNQELRDLKTKSTFLEISEHDNIYKSTCKAINILTEIFYSNFELKFLIIFRQYNINSEIIFILKYYSSSYYFYLRITVEKVELLKRENENNILLKDISVKREGDKAIVLNGSKNIYLEVTAVGLDLNVSVRINFEKIPNESALKNLNFSMAEIFKNEPVQIFSYNNFDFVIIHLILDYLNSIGLFRYGRVLYYFPS